MPMEIQTPEGRVKAMTPVILSASRSTDIPAYYPKNKENLTRSVKQSSKC